MVKNINNKIRIILHFLESTNMISKKNLLQKSKVLKKKLLEKKFKKNKLFFCKIKDT